MSNVLKTPPSTWVFGPHDYPDDWEQTFLWHAPVSVHFGYPGHGWALMALMGARNSSVVIRLSNVFPVFHLMVDWLKAIAAGQLPAVLELDEEGRLQWLVVTRYDGRHAPESDIEVRALGRFWYEDGAGGEDPEKKRCYFLCRASRQQFVGEFCRRLEAWLEEDYRPEDWDDHYGDAWDEEEDGPRPDLRRELDRAWLQATAAARPPHPARTAP